MVWRPAGFTTTSVTGQVSQDHIFESTESRDAYFTDNLDELISGTPIIVNTDQGVQLQTWGGTTNPDSYDNSMWAEALNITGDQIVNLIGGTADANLLTDPQLNTLTSVSGLTENRIPAATAIGLADTRHRIEDDNLFVAGSLEVESGTIALGELVSLSESGGLVSYTNSIDGIRRNLIDQLTPTTEASGRARRLALSGAETRQVISSGSDSSIESTEITASYTTQQAGRANAIIISSFSGINNLRIRITSTSPGTPATVKYIPSRESWVNETGGLNVSDSSDPTTVSEHTIRLDDSPLVYDVGRTLEVAYRIESGDLAGSNGIPFLAALIQQGGFSELADRADVPDSITDLTYTPDTLGTVNQVLAVNAGADALEFVDPVIGTGLTPEDQTKLDGIAEGAEVNVQPDWDETDSNDDSFIQNKPTIPDEFTDFSDTPSSITANQFVRGNSSGDALEFVDLPTRLPTVH